jgi:hypothetical protein
MFLGVPLAGSVFGATFTAIRTLGEIRVVDSL